MAKAATRGAGCGIQLVWECLLFHQPRDSEFKLIGQASLSAQFQLKLKVSVSFSICIGPICGGVQANGFWDMAVGVDLALTTTTAGSNGLDGLDKLGCREWAFQSKLTNYAEYPQSDCVSTPCHHGS